MEKQKKLGRGINALIPNKKMVLNNEFLGDSYSSKEIVDIPIEKLILNPNQPRITFDDKKIQELADSIKNHGVLEPLLVTKHDDNSFGIVAGERRYRASIQADLKTIPSIVLSLQEEEKIEIALIENIQREDLNPIETAISFEKIIALKKISQEELAKKISVSRPVVTNLLRLLTLPKNIQKALIEKKITQSHARLLLSEKNSTRQQEIFKQIVTKDLTVKSLEKTVQREKKHPTDKMTSYEQKLIEFFGTKTTIQGSINKGKIQIAYFSQEDFSRILDILHITIE